MYQYILCLSKLPRAWTDILLPRSGVLQRARNTPRWQLAEFVPLGEEEGRRNEGSDEETDETQRAVTALPCLFDISLSSAREYPVPPPRTRTQKLLQKHSHICHPHLSRIMRTRVPTFAHIHNFMLKHVNTWVYSSWKNNYAWGMHLFMFFLCLSKCLCLQNISETREQILTKQTESLHWTDIYNWKTFRGNLVQDGRFN